MSAGMVVGRDQLMTLIAETRPVWSPRRALERLSRRGNAVALPFEQLRHSFVNPVRSSNVATLVAETLSSWLC
jgi:hypothetical protein